MEKETKKSGFSMIVILAFVLLSVCLIFTEVGMNIQKHWLQDPDLGGEGVVMQGNGNKDDGELPDSTWQEIEFIRE